MAKDYAQITDGTGTKIKTIRKTQGADTVEVQSLTLDWDRLDFGGATPNQLDSVSTPQEASAVIDCEGKSYILCKVEYSNSTGYAALGLILEDWNASVAKLYTERVYSPNTGSNAGVLESGYYNGVMVMFMVYGAKQARVRLVTTPTDSASISVWGIAV